jgi:hypothetical protein
MKVRSVTFSHPQAANGSAFDDDPVGETLQKSTGFIGRSLNHEALRSLRSSISPSLRSVAARIWKIAHRGFGLPIIKAASAWVSRDAGSILAHQFLAWRSWARVNVQDNDAIWGNRASVAR